MELVLEQTQQEHLSEANAFTMKMEILLEPTSNKLLVDTYQVNNTTKDGVRLRLFPFSLKDQAKAWFTSLEPGEQFHEAFSRLKELLRTCPHHDVPKWELVKVFYDRGGSHVINILAFDVDDFLSWKDRDTKIAALILKFNAFKALEGEKDEESLSFEDEGVTTVKAFMAIAKYEPSMGKVDARSGQYVEITIKK
nr:hypothetical protein [Tanacetum cinerariifolium]